MARRPLDWSFRAEADLARIESFYASECSPLIAHEAANAILTAVERLCAAPERYRTGPKNTREYVMRRFPYIIVYRLEGERVRIVRVMRQARKYFNR